MLKEMTRSHWQLWVNSKTEEKAHSVLEDVLVRMAQQAHEITIEPYPKIGGFVISFVVMLESQAWNDRIVEVIDLGQSVAVGWIITGRVRTTDVGGWSNEVKVAGGVSMQWQLLD